MASALLRSWIGTRAAIPPNGGFVFIAQCKRSAALGSMDNGMHPRSGVPQSIIFPKIYFKGNLGLRHPTSGVHPIIHATQSCASLALGYKNETPIRGFLALSFLSILVTCYLAAPEKLDRDRGLDCQHCQSRPQYRTQKRSQSSFSSFWSLFGRIWFGCSRSGLSCLDI